jgi:two-component system sensor histidine kinase/response regulator
MAQEFTRETEQSILIVDDNPTNVQLLSVMLKERGGYKVRAALSGKLALQAARNNPPDLILLDIYMPGMNGYEVCEQLKADEATRGIPVIFISALNETVDKVRAFEAGGVDYITKPFQFKEFEARVHTHLELRRQRRELQQSYAQLREAERLRDNLVHMIAHDLRNSLTAISGYFELIMLSDGKVLSQKSTGYVRKGADSIYTLVGIINTMLDVNRMEAGAMKPNLAPCDLVGVAKKVLSDMEAVLGKTELILDLPVQHEIVKADRELIIRVLQNLVVNALKAIPAGGWVRVGVAFSGSSVRVTVSDNGAGISPEYRQKIFDKFGKVEAGPGAGKYSTGLGLTFCKLAVEAHGGRIGVESEVGAGSAFWFELPREQTNNPPAD